MTDMTLLPHGQAAPPELFAGVRALVDSLSFVTGPLWLVPALVLIGVLATSVMHFAAVGRKP